MTEPKLAIVGAIMDQPRKLIHDDWNYLRSWYPALNLDRALALSWVGRFCCFIQELVTAAPAAASLLPLLTFCLDAAQGTQPRLIHTQSASESLLLLANHTLPHSR